MTDQRNVLLTDVRMREAYRNILLRHGITTLGQLADMKVFDVMQLKKCNRQVLSHYKDILKKHGLRLADGPSEHDDALSDRIDTLDSWYREDRKDLERHTYAFEKHQQNFKALVEKHNQLAAAVRKMEDTGVAGISLRDHFAIAALTGLLAGRSTVERPNYGEVAYEFADAMMKAREVK